MLDLCGSPVLAFCLVIILTACTNLITPSVSDYKYLLFGQQITVSHFNQEKEY